MIIKNEKSAVTKICFTAWPAVLCLLCFIFFAFPALSQTQYPWEKDAAAAKDKRTSRQVEKTTSSGNQWDADSFTGRLRLGNFQVRIPADWVKIPSSLEEEMGGQGIFKVKVDGTSVSIVLDEEPRSYSQDADRISFEQVLSKNVANNSPDAIRYLDIMGNRTRIIRSPDDDDGTLFYVLPYDGPTCYPFYVTYEQRVTRLTPEIKAILSTLQIVN